MNSKLSTKQILILVALGVLILLIPFVLALTKQKQEIRKKAAGSGEVQIKLDPQQDSKQPGESFIIKVTLQSDQTRQVNAANCKLLYDKNIFEISTPTCGTSFPTVAGNSVDSTNGFIYIGCGVGGGSEPVNVSSTPVILGQFQVTVKNSASPGQTQISFAVTPQLPYVSDPNGNNLSDTGTPGIYTITQEGAPTATPTPPTATPTPPPTATPTPTPTPYPPGEVNIKFKVRFSGVDDKKPDQLVKVKIGKEGNILQEIEGVNLTANNQGIYESQMINLSSTITPGTNYYLLIKGPKHLQVRFCQNSGQVRPCTTGRITLNSGENILDFTGYPLPGGDLPPQDGVVNAIDAVALVNCLFETTPACLQKADLNFDEIINTMDVNIMNNTIYSRWEDE